MGIIHDALDAAQAGKTAMGDALDGAADKVRAISLLDPEYWASVGDNANRLLDDPMAQATALKQTLMQPAYTASLLSKQQFPGQDWDLTQRNALRHATWVGGMARAMGAGPDAPILTPIAQGLAKGAGYANEGISYAERILKGEPLDDPAYVNDTLHDLNANAVGAQVAGQALTDVDFKKMLIAKAMGAQVRPPAGLLQPSDGQLSVEPGTPVSRWWSQP